MNPGAWRLVSTVMNPDWNLEFLRYEPFIDGYHSPGLLESKFRKPMAIVPNVLPNGEENPKWHSAPYGIRMDRSGKYEADEVTVELYERTMPDHPPYPE